MGKTQSFRTKLWLYFVLFAALIFSLLWLLQTVGLQRFYDDMMENNIRRAAQTMIAASKSDDFLEIIDHLTFEDSLLVYITDEQGRVYYSSDSYNSYFRKNPGPGRRLPGGKNFPSRPTDPSDFQTGTFRNLPANYDFFLAALAESKNGTVEYTSENSFIYGTRITLDDDADKDDDDDEPSEVILFVAGTLGPVGAAASIIRTQLLWVTGLSLVLAFVIAWIISRRFDKPIKQLNEQAKMLSEEKYEDRFEKGFCRELDELNDSLTESAEKLAEAREYQKDLLANVSHDLRTPLTMIKGYAEMVRDISWEDEAQRNEDTGVIIKEADRMTALVNEILEYAQLKQTNAAISMTAVDFSALTERVTDRFEPIFRAEGGTIERNITLRCLVKGNESLLERAVFNLIDNAVRHSGDKDKRITVSIQKDGAHACLTVRDYGDGIDPAELPHIWEKYYTSRQRNGKGVSGLGLAIVKQTAQLHHAEVSAESTPGEGSTFTFSMLSFPESNHTESK